MERDLFAPADVPPDRTNLYHHAMEQANLHPALGLVASPHGRQVHFDATGPGKDVADRLDGELRSFADAKLDNPSDNIVSFQKMVGAYCDDADKKQAIGVLGEGSSKLRVQIATEAEGLSNSLRVEVKNNPTENALHENFLAQSRGYWSKLDAQPFSKRNQVLDLMEWKPGETESQHEARVSAGLSGNKPLQTAFNRMELAFDKYESGMTPHMKAEEAKLQVDDADLQTIRQVVNKASIRSQIPF